MPNLGFEEWDSPPSVHGFKGGDLYGVLEHLDYLQDLGITAIYLNPIFSSASNHRYHTYDYYEVDPLLGGNAALEELLEAAHRRKMRVILDGVFNHASRGFWQFHHVLETGAASPYKDWFHFDPERLEGKKRWGAHPTEEELRAIHHEGSLKAIGYQGWWNMPALPKFNTTTKAVRDFLFGVAEHWIRFGVDGWRLDVPGEIDDDSFWQEFRHRVKAANPEAYIVGEIWHEAQRWLQGDQFDGVMNYPLTAAALGFFSGDHLDPDVVRQAGGLQGRVRSMDAPQFANEIDRIMNLYPGEITHAQLNLLSSHDMPRFITCAGGDQGALKLALLFLFTIPGAPCIFYGDEIGLTGRQDPECRKSFPQIESKWDRELLDYAKNIIRLRKSHPALRRGSYEPMYAVDGVYAFNRSDQKQNLLIVLNNADAPRNIGLAAPPMNKKPQVLFGEPLNLAYQSGLINIELSSRSGLVLQYKISKGGAH